MFTRVHRIDLAQVGDLTRAIVELSDSMLAGGFHLAASFVFESQLIIIYQRQP